MTHASRAAAVAAPAATAAPSAAAAASTWSSQGCGSCLGAYMLCMLVHAGLPACVCLQLPSCLLTCVACTHAAAATSCTDCRRPPSSRKMQAPPAAKAAAEADVPAELPALDQLHPGDPVRAIRTLIQHQQQLRARAAAGAASSSSSSRPAGERMCKLHECLGSSGVQADQPDATPQLCWLTTRAPLWLAAALPACSQAAAWPAGAAAVVIVSSSCCQAHPQLA